MNLGGKSASDMIGDDIAVEFDGLTGKVTGKVKHLTDFKGFGSNDPDGHFFPVTLDDSYKGKDITVISATRAKTERDHEWILKIDKNKVFTFKADGETILVLDFTGATLEE